MGTKTGIARPHIRCARRNTGSRSNKPKYDRRHQRGRISSSQQCTRRSLRLCKHYKAQLISSKPAEKQYDNQRRTGHKQYCTGLSRTTASPYRRTTRKRICIYVTDLRRRFLLTCRPSFVFIILYMYVCCYKVCALFVIYKNSQRAFTSLYRKWERQNVTILQVTIPQVCLYSYKWTQ